MVIDGELRCLVLCWCVWMVSYTVNRLLDGS